MAVNVDQEFVTIKAACEQYRNWGRWGPDDQLGTVNFITPAMVLAAGKLMRRGKVFSLSLPFDQTGPQRGIRKRFNPMAFMLRDGADTCVGEIAGSPQGYGGADDVIMMPTHGATHWDALSHVFWDSKMFNGYPAQLVNSLGAGRNGIQNYRDRIVGRGVLLDIPRLKGVDFLEVGYPITNADLDAAADRQKVAVGTGDIVLVRTGHIGLCRKAGSWGTYAAGDAPGLGFETASWLAEHEVAGVATDTWGVEVRPNELNWIAQPWHRVAIPNMGLLVGEMFDLDDFAADCATTGIYEFLFVAQPLSLTGAVGSPINPLALT